MIGLMFLLMIGLWIILAIYLGRKISFWIGLKTKRVWSVVIAAVFICIPISDEIVGKYQFEQLCGKYEIVQSSAPNQSYEKLSVSLQADIELTDVIRPTTISVEQYAEANSRIVVRSDRTVLQKDGWILRWLGLAATSHCRNALIWKLSPQENAIRTNLGMSYIGDGKSTQRITSTTGELNTVLKKFDIAEEHKQ